MDGVEPKDVPKTSVTPNTALPTMFTEPVNVALSVEIKVAVLLAGEGKCVGVSALRASKA